MNSDKRVVVVRCDAPSVPAELVDAYHGGGADAARDADFDVGDTVVWDDAVDYRTWRTCFMIHPQVNKRSHLKRSSWIWCTTRKPRTKQLGTLLRCRQNRWTHKHKHICICTEVYFKHVCRWVKSCVCIVIITHIAFNVLFRWKSRWSY